MKLKLRNKKFGWDRFWNSFKYSYQGLKHAYSHEQSLFIHLVITIFSLFLGIVFKIGRVEWIVTIAFLGLVLSLELLNTAIEAVVDMVTKDFNQLAKVAKDCASASVFVASILGLIAGLIIYVPKIVELL